mgnify:FL=1
MSKEEWMTHKMKSWIDSTIQWIYEKWKRYYLNKEIDKAAYHDLAPNDMIENGEEYFKALYWALHNDRIKNIALTGPYGSGKSSIIESYIRQNPGLKYIRISLATFVEYVENQGADTKIDGKLITFTDNKIEEGILKQLFYKVDSKKIPLSRYRKIHRIILNHIFCKLIGFAMCCGILLYIFYPDTAGKIYNLIILANERTGVHYLLLSAVLVMIMGIFLRIIAHFFRYILSNARVKEVKIGNQATVNLDKDGDSIFDKNMDEIVYFFESTEYDVVFFEDLDRLKSAKIFIQLRELNTILNNYDNIKDTIRFVYAIKDDIFSNEDRTKFFDFIIPVVPVINSTNSGDVFRQYLRQMREEDISEAYIDDVSPYISDMRVLQNIFNEFKIYKNTIKMNQELKLVDEMMMSLIIFKNLYPKDFSDIQAEKGIIKIAFHDRKNAINKYRTELQNDINIIKNELLEIHNEVLQDTRELKSAFLVALTDGKGFAYKINISGYGIYNLWNIIYDDTFDLLELSKICDKKSGDIYYHDIQNGNNSSIYGKELYKIVDGYAERWERLKIFENKQINSVYEKIQNKKNEINNIMRWSLKKCIEKLGSDTIFSTQVKENKFLVFLFRRGYIDETYVNYINYFKADSMTTSDMNFILSIKNQENLDFDYHLTKISQIVKRLRISEFEQKGIYNFFLLEYLLGVSPLNDGKLLTYMKQLSDGAQKSWQFIDEFIDITKYKERFIELLAEYWNEMWDNISSNVMLSYDRKIFYFNNLLQYVPVEVLKTMDEKKSISNFFVEHKDLLQRTNTISTDILKNVVEELDIYFKNINTDGVQSGLLNFIFETCHYELNNDMVKNLVKFKDVNLLHDLAVKNYTTILNLNYIPLVKYIYQNIEVYIRENVLQKENTDESERAVAELLFLCSDNIEICKEIIRHECICFESFKEIKFCQDIKYTKNIWDNLIEHDKVKATWENIYEYWLNFSFLSNILDFLQRHACELMHSDIDDLSEKFIVDFIYNQGVGAELLDKVLPYICESAGGIDLQLIGEEKTNVLIRHRLIAFSIEKYDEIKELYPDLSIDFILNNKNEFLDNIKNIELSDELVSDILDKARADKDFCEQVYKAFDLSDLTAEIAEKILLMDMTISKEDFQSFWNAVDVSYKEKLMMQCLQILNDDDFEMCFKELGNPYHELADRSRRHNVMIKQTDASVALVKRLKEIQYITSFKMPSKDDNSPISVIVKRKKQE